MFILYFIVNPVAGKGKGQKVVSIIKKYLTKNNIEFLIKYSLEPNHATTLAKEAVHMKATKVIAVGGDGTIQEVVDGLAYKNIPLGIIPIGTGNDFSKNLPTYKNIYETLDKIIEGNILDVDLINISGKYFLNISSIGIDAEVVRGSKDLKKTFGSFSYLASVFNNIFTYKSIQAKIKIDDLKLRGKYTLIAVANGKYYGGAFKIAPSASINDGLISVCVIEHLSPIQILFLFPTIFFGKHVNLKEVVMYTGKEVIIEYEDNYLVNVDGTLYDFNNPLTFKIEEKAIKIII